MEIEKAIKLSTELLDLHNLKSWRVQINPRIKRALGRCKFRPMVIELGEEYVLKNDEVQVKLTILHEIAHCLVGAGNGHNWKWKMKLKEIGGSYVRDLENLVVPDKKWKGRCPSCGYEYQSYVRRNGFCPHCVRKAGKFSQEFLIQYTKIN